MDYGIAGKRAVVLGAIRGLAPAVAFLASHQAADITASVIRVDGVIVKGF